MMLQVQCIFRILLLSSLIFQFHSVDALAGFGNPNSKKVNKSGKTQTSSSAGGGFVKPKPKTKATVTVAAPKEEEKEELDDADADADAEDNTPPSPPQLQTIQLGPNKSVNIWVPPNSLEGNQDEISKFTKKKNRAKLLNAYATFRGTGDVIWPSSLHLSRLVANCPSFVTNKRVLDLGCGLGLASLATLMGNPSHLTLCDVDQNVLDWAFQSCEEANQANSDADADADADANSNSETTTNGPTIERLALDWSDPSTWPQPVGCVDIVLASDVLYDEEATEHVSKLLAHLLGDAHLTAAENDSEPGRALIVDPANRPYRDAFVERAFENGLVAEPVPFPGQAEEFVLINVTPRSLF